MQEDIENKSLTLIINSAINQAMAAYSVAWARQQKQERFAAEPVLDPTREAPAKKVERIRQKGMER